jgi:predicted amidohydrolase YtcJ
VELAVTGDPGLLDTDVVPQQFQPDAEALPMSRVPAEPLALDYLIKARAVHSMTGEIFRSIGVRGPEIVAVSAEADGLDNLARRDTVVADVSDLTVLPAFGDSHEHLVEASRSSLLVPVDRARSVAEFTSMVADASTSVAPDEWVLTSIGWHESNLAENRLPTLAELDAAAPDHPVLARRGGHLAVVNSAALRAAGISAHTQDPPGGKIGRLADGRRDGVLEGGAVYQVAAFAPGPSRAALAGALGNTSAAYAALGVGTIREAMTTLDDLLAYQDAWEQGMLQVRVQLMMRIGSELSTEDAIAFIRGLGARSGYGDDWLRIWGLKLVLDGGVEGAALDEPYANDAANFGHLNWEPAAMAQVCVEAVRRGWRIGTHAVGDRAVRTLLDVYEAVVGQTGPLPPWTLVIEHGMLTDAALRERAVNGGFGVTVQYPLLWNMASEMLSTWGPERTRRVTPLREWLAAGADLAAGTDIVRPFNPMTNVWGMVTRGTKNAGVQGPEHGIDAATALRLYTMGTAALNHEQDRLGSIAPGKLADLVGYPVDPVTADPSILADLFPRFTMAGGRVTHDADQLLTR